MFFNNSVKEDNVMSFSVKKGNLLEAETDAIVIPASPQVSQGCGVSRHVYEAAGNWHQHL